MSNTLSPLRRLANLLPNSSAYKARADYDQAVQRSVTLWLHLDERGAINANTRSRLLSSLAVCDEQLSAGYRDGYGLGWDDAADVVRMYDDSAELLGLLASTSALDRQPYSRTKGRADWEDAFGAILDDLTKAADHPQVYAEYLVRLYFAVAEHVDAEVAETVNSLIAAIFRATDNANHPRTTTAA